MQGQDDEVLLHIFNTSRAGTPDFVPTTIEQYRIGQRSPDWNGDGKFFSEVDGTPVGLVTGYVDPKRKDPVGHLGGPWVLPAFRRRGIGTELAGRALDHIRARGLTRVRTGVAGWDQAGTAFVRRLGFEPVRRFSRMLRPLVGLPSGIGERRDAAIDPVGTSDAEMPCWFGCRTIHSASTSRIATARSSSGRSGRRTPSRRVTWCAIPWPDLKASPSGT